MCQSRINSSKVLEAIEIHQGLLVQRASDIYSFSHLTIQEYLTSYYFFSKSKIQELVNNHLFNKKWREVFLLLSGMSNTDELLFLCVNKLNNSLKVNKKNAEYIRWSQKMVVPSENAEENLANRIFLLSFLLLYIRKPSESYVSPSGLADYQEVAVKTVNKLTSEIQFKYYRNLNRKRTIKTLQSLKELPFLKIDITPCILMVEKVEDKSLSGLTGSLIKQNRKFLKIILQCLGFDFNLYKPGYVKLKPLVDYLEACYFLIQCKEQSLVVTKKAWEKTCDSLVVYGEEL